MFEAMPMRQKIFALLLSIGILILIVELVRRRRLREEYSWLWMLTGCVMILLILWYDVLVALTHVIGAVLPTSTLFLFGLIFLMLISLHFSVKISALANQMKDLAQQIALLSEEKLKKPLRRRKRSPE